MDDILVKLGLDATSLARGITALRGQLGELSERGHSGFVHMGEAGRSFHKLMEKITEASPIAGAALRGLFTPVAAAIILATMALAAFNKRLEEQNKILDEISTHNAGAVTNNIDRQNKLHDHAVDAVTDEMHFQQKLNEAHDETLDNLKIELEHLENIKAIKEESLKSEKDLTIATKERRALETSILTDTKKAQQDAATNIGTRLADEKRRENAFYRQYRSDPEIKRQLDAQNEVEADKANLQRLTQARIAAQTEQSKVGMGPVASAARLAQGLKTYAELDKEIQDYDEQIQRAKENQKRHNDQLQPLTDDIKKFKDEWDHSKERVTKLSEAQYSLEQALRATEMKLKAQANAPGLLREFQPSMAEFQQMPGPLGNLARLMGRQQQFIGNALLSGRGDLAEIMRQRLQGTDFPNEFATPDWAHGGRLVRGMHHVKGTEEVWRDIMKAMFGDEGVPVRINSVNDFP